MASNAISAVALFAAQEELQRGVKEVPDGSNRGERIDIYTGMVGKDPVLKGPAWCAYWVSWCFAQAPGGSPFKRIGGAQAIAFWGDKHGCTTWRPYSCKAGDIFVIANSEVRGHVGIVRAYEAGTIWTIEGNAGNAVRTFKRKLIDCVAIVNFDNWERAKTIKG